MSVKRLLFLVSIILFISFIYFSYLVSKETFTQIDFDFTVKLQDRLPRRLDLPFSLLSVIGSAEITGVIWGITFIWFLIKKNWPVILTLPLFFLALIIEIFGKVFVHHPSPPFLFYRGVIDFNFPSHFVHSNYSYPSGHMTRSAFLIAFGITYLILKGKIASKIILIPGLLIFLTLMIVSRVYLGEHWLSDVIGGTLIGLSFGIIPALLVKPKQKQINFLG